MFYIRNSSYLQGIQLVAYNAWRDSNNWSKKDDLHQLYAHVIRDYINELLPAVAFITGGYKLMRRVSAESRELFIKEVLFCEF